MSEQKGPEGRIVDHTPDLHEGIKFFGNRTCPFAHRAWWSLLEKEVDFDYIHIDLGATKPDWYQREVNPYGSTPCLYDHGKPVFESINVAEYVHERFPDQGTPLMPTDPWERALVREFISKVEAKPFLTLLMTTDLGEQEKAKEGVFKELERLNKKYEQASKSGPYFLGERLSLADVSIVTILERFERTLKHFREFEMLPSNHGGYPRLRSLMEAVRERPAFKPTSQDSEVYIKAHEKYAKKTNAQLRQERS